MSRVHHPVNEPGWLHHHGVDTVRCTNVLKRPTLSAVIFSLALSGCVANGPKPGGGGQGVSDETSDVSSAPAISSASPGDEPMAQTQPDMPAAPAMEKKAAPGPSAVSETSDDAPGSQKVGGKVSAERASGQPPASITESSAIMKAEASTVASRMPADAPTQKQAVKKVASVPAKDAASRRVTTGQPNQESPVKAVESHEEKSSESTQEHLQAAADNAKRLEALSLDNLPARFGPWIVEKSYGSDSVNAVISTPTWQMGEGDHSSQIWIKLMPGKLIVNSSSDIDLGTGNTGIQVDKGPLIPFTRLEGTNAAVVEKPLEALLKGGKTLNIFLGFWPNETPRGKTYRSDISLKALQPVLPAYLKLVQ